MTRLIHSDDANDRFLAWARARIPHVGPEGFGPAQAVGIGSHDGSKLLAVVVYSGLQHQTLQISAAASSPKWATPGNIRALLAYPFLQLGCRKVWMAIAHDNARSLRFNLGIGFKKEATLRHHYAHGQHAVIVSMMRNEWSKRWAPKGFVDGSRN